MVTLIQKVATFFDWIRSDFDKLYLTGAYYFKFVYINFNMYHAYIWKMNCSYDVP
jgi:hypothetical protein